MTIGNVIRDLNMFGIVTVEQSKIRLDSSMEAADQEKILQRLRQVLKSHALTMGLSKRDPGEIIKTQDIIQLLKQINPAAQHQENTWKTYAERMGDWLSVTGYPCSDRKWLASLKIREKLNLEDINKTRKTRPAELPFLWAPSSPVKYRLEALDYFRDNQPLSMEEIEAKGFRNALVALRGTRS